LSDGQIDGSGHHDAAQTNGHELSPSNHFIQFYETDAFLLDVVCRFIGTGIRGGDTGVVIATETHREGLEQRLQALGLDIQEALEEGRYVSIDASATAAALVAKGSFDADLFEAFIRDIVTR